MNYRRHSPLFGVQQAMQPEWADYHGMQVAARFAADGDEQDAVDDLALCDLSVLPRFGLKGEAAAAWLHERGVVTPDRVYGWLPLAEGGGRCMRIGQSEFFLEDRLNGSQVDGLRASCEPGRDLVVVPRQNAALLLCGSRAHLVLAQTCAIAPAVLCRQLVFTGIAGVNALVLGSGVGVSQCYRLWITASYAIYFWETLLGIGVELGGRAVGLESLGRKVGV